MAGTPDLSPYLGQRNAVRQDFAAKSAANTFSKTLSQQRGSRQQADFTRGFNRQLPQYTSQFGARGLAGGGIQSGVMENAMRNYIGDYTREFGQMKQDQFSDQRGFDLDQSRFLAERDNALANINAQQQAQIAATAQHIAALRPFMGGFY